MTNSVLEASSSHELKCVSSLIILHSSPGKLTATWVASKCRKQKYKGGSLDMSLMRNGNNWRGFRSEIDRLFDDFFTGGGLAAKGQSGQGSQNFWAPLVDV